LVSSNNVAGGAAHLVGGCWLGDVLDHGLWELVGGCGGSDLSGSWLNLSDLWAHVFVLENGLVLHCLRDAAKLDALPHKIADKAPDSTKGNNNSEDSLNLFSCNSLVRIREVIKPVLIWVTLLPAALAVMLGVALVIFVIIVLTWSSLWLLSMLLSMVLLTVMEQGFSELSKVEFLLVIGNQWFALELLLPDVIKIVNSLIHHIIDILFSIIKFFIPSDLAWVEIREFWLIIWSFLSWWLEVDVIRHLPLLLGLSWVISMSKLLFHVFNRVGAVHTVVVHGDVLVFLINPGVNHLILEVLVVANDQEANEKCEASELSNLFLELKHLLGFSLGHHDALGSTGLGILVFLHDWSEHLMDGLSLNEGKCTNNNFEECEHEPGVSINGNSHFLTIDVSVRHLVVATHEDHDE